MEQNKKVAAPDNTAVRVALWRAMHVQVDAAPHIIEDEIGFKLVAPADEWRERPDMNPDFTRRLRASMVARARFIEDLVTEQRKRGIDQYVILGAGLDSFAQRRPDMASALQIFEIDQPATQTWKKQRLGELGFGIPKWLHFVSVDFEISSWWEQLINAGFNTGKPAVAACTGVTLYLTKDAILATLRRFATLAPGSTLAMTFYLPLELLDEEDRFLQEIAEKGARAAGTPFISFFSPEEMLALAREAGFKDAEIVSSKDLDKRYFSGRTDLLRPASGEEFLVATNKPDWPALPQPDDSVSFFEAIKKISERYWQDISLNKDIYGFQVQPGTKWRQGLAANEINEFEKEIGFSFPIPLKNFYSVMNGLTKPGINIYGSDGTPESYHPIYYSFPGDLKLIKDMTDWVYEETETTKEKIENENVSKIFPITGHRFLLVDLPDHPILSMHGSDIIYWADNLSKLLAIEIFDNIFNVSDFENPSQKRADIRFWLDQDDRK